MDTMSIAAMSVGMNQAQLQQNVGIAALGKVFDEMKSSADIITELSVGSDSNLGTSVDISV